MFAQVLGKRIQHSRLMALSISLELDPRSVLKTLLRFLGCNTRQQTWQAVLTAGSCRVVGTVDIVEMGRKLVVVAAAAAAMSVATAALADGRSLD